MKLRWTSAASRMLRSIFQFIAADDPVAANKVATSIRNISLNLITFPRMGCIGRVEGTRELVVPELPYILVYRITDTEVHILRVFHAKQDRP